jgi:hypothetical protein
MEDLDKLAREIFLVMIVLIFVFLLADLSTSVTATCEGCGAVPIINLLPALK